MHLYKTVVGVPLLMALTACGTMDKVKDINLWPFDGKDEDQSIQKYYPANAIKFQCDKGKSFFVRMLDKGESVWLITSDREVGLPKTNSGAYSSGSVNLLLDKEKAELQLAPEVVYTNCNRVQIK